jgi:hypothetical protein
MWHILVRRRTAGSSRRSGWRREPRPQGSRHAGGVAEGCTGEGSSASLGGPSQGTTHRPTARSATAHAHNGSSGERCGRRVSPVADRRLDPAALHPHGHLDQLGVAGPVQDGVGAASLTARTEWSNSLARNGGRQRLHAAFGRHTDAQQGRSARRQPSLPATAPCRRCGRHALLGGPVGPGSIGPSPCGPGSGVTPAQRRPAATPASRQRHGPLLLGRCGACPSP